MLAYLIRADKAGDFEGVRIYESRLFGCGYGSGGITLPGWGIVVGKGVYSEQLDMEVLMHEYGHWLQYQRVGWWRFYLYVGVPSVISAMRSHWDRSYRHQSHWVEQWANHLAQEYFLEHRWAMHRFPPSELPHTRRWIVDGSRIA